MTLQKDENSYTTLPPTPSQIDDSGGMLCLMVSTARPLSQILTFSLLMLEKNILSLQSPKLFPPDTGLVARGLCWSDLFVLIDDGQFPLT